MKKPKLPPGLSKESQKLFRETRDQFDLDDAPSLVLLGNACRALDRLRAAELIVRKEGAIYRDRFAQPKSHPAAARMDSEGLAFMRAIRELGINLAPLPQGGKPPEGI